jgi:hypothetical protein
MPEIRLLNQPINDGFIITGLAEILGRFPRCQSLDLEEASDLVDDPAVGEATFPFGQPASGASRKSHGKPQESAPKGTTVKHSKKVQKFGGRKLPEEIKRYLFENWPLAEEMRTGQWPEIFADIEAGALANSTWKKYCSVINKFESFRADLNLSGPWDFSEKMLNSFAVWGKAHGLSAGSVKSYLSSLETLAGLAGIELGVRNKKTRKIVLKGLENLDLLEGPKCRPSDPFTFEVMAALKNRLRKKNWRPESKRVVWAACTLGYFGALRAGEMLPKTEKVFDQFSDLLWDDVKILPDGIQIRVKEPKIPTSGGDIVDIFRIENKNFCPVRAVQKLKQSQKREKIWSKTLPVFRFGSGKNLTVSELSRLMKVLLKKTKFRDRNITAKSIRSGLPSDMETRPDLMHDAHVKCWGRWRSKSYQAYMKKDRIQRRWIFEKICKALNL